MAEPTRADWEAGWRLCFEDDAGEVFAYAPEHTFERIVGLLQTKLGSHVEALNAIDAVLAEIEGHSPRRTRWSSQSSPEPGVDG